ncbi:LADA_0F04214g1_1 [Lachancea dasiensis]|uniref:LADA_0F04214g1_1 n=1 Tax=Lachancea dasiensis TaxID=1072105 RepID=A0A1G4JJ03_9SACH|nr:LADA_0F04214g1_1 [Lachancea dasiensis]
MAKLSEEYFDLVRSAIREDKQLPKRKRRRLPKYKQEVPQEPSVVINLESEASDNNSGSKSSDHNSQLEDDDFDSEDFEDILEPDTARPSTVRDLSITLDAKTPDDASKPKSKNTIGNEERKFRKSYHMLHLLALMIHGRIRNTWLNDSKLHSKLSRLVPDDVFELLHPKKDDELPLRSTRKLLDGLKKCMEIWWKHFDQITRWETQGLFMIRWDELDGPWEQPARYMSQKLFNKKVLHGKGSSEVAAQGFVAMLRSCGVNARLVFNIQPPDFTDHKLIHASSTKNPGEYLADQASSGSRVKWKVRSKVKGTESKHSIFWCEVWDKISKKWITIDPMGQRIIEQIRFKTSLEPQGKARQNNIFRYIIAYDRKDGCRDVTRRYTTHFNSKVRKRRITKDVEGEKWFQRVLSLLQGRRRTRTDDLEDAYFKERDEGEGIPDNMQDLRSHPYYVLENDLKWNEILKTGCKECGFLRTKNNSTSLKVFRRDDILTLKTARTWYTEGRILKSGAKAMKTAKSRDFKTGEPTEERLYPYSATDLFIPEPLGLNNEVSTNVYGNIDIYVDTMIPRGSCLVESPVAVKAAAFLRVEFAKAVTSFKFEKKRVAKPQITGVVIAQDYREAIEAMIDGIEYSMEEDERQERELESLRCWDMLLAKLRIKQRLIAKHGAVNGSNESSEWPERSSFDTGAAQEEDLENYSNEESFETGGFLPEAGGFVPETAASDVVSGGFGSEDENSPSQRPENLPAVPTSTSVGKPTAENDYSDYEDFMKDMMHDESDHPNSNFSKTDSDSDFHYESE